MFRHVGLRWGMSVSDRSPMKRYEVSDQACLSPMGLLSGMSVSDSNNIFVNSVFSLFFVKNAFILC